MNKAINFHAVDDAAWFEMVVVYLKKRYNIISSQQLYDYYYKGIKLKNSCLITVDDGHMSSYEIIYPILKKHNVPAIFFISPEIAKREKEYNFWFQDYLTYDKSKLKEIYKTFVLKPEEPFTNDFVYSLDLQNIKAIISKYQQLYSVEPLPPMNMTVEQIKEIDKDGLIEIGAHTLNHPLLSKVKDEVSKREIQDSINDLEEILGHKITTFAYPNGRPILDWGDREVEYMKETTIKLAFSTQPKNISRKDSVFGIPRYGLSNGSLSFIKIKLFLGKYYTFIHKLLK